LGVLPRKQARPCELTGTAPRGTHRRREVDDDRDPEAEIDEPQSARAGNLLVIAALITGRLEAAKVFAHELSEHRSLPTERKSKYSMSRFVRFPQRSK
jgi:hypothetical protein